MDNRTLFTDALGLQPPWEVARIEFDPKGRRLDLHLDFARGRAFPARRGTRPVPPSTTPRTRPGATWTSSSTRRTCTLGSPGSPAPPHGVRLVPVPWARQGSGFTLLFEAVLMALISEMPVKAAAGIVGEQDTRLCRVLHHHVDRARERTSCGGVAQVGIDETSSRCGQDYGLAALNAVGTVAGAYYPAQAIISIWSIVLFAAEHHVGTY
jgi:transposase